MLRFEPNEYARLAERAKPLGVPMSALVRTYVHAGLERDSNGTSREQHRNAIEAIESLTALCEERRRAGYPSVDAQELVRFSREELERRASQ